MVRKHPQAFVHPLLGADEGYGEYALAHHPQLWLGHGWRHAPMKGKARSDSSIVGTTHGLADAGAARVEPLRGVGRASSDAIWVSVRLSRFRIDCEDLGSTRQSYIILIIDTGPASVLRLTSLRRVAHHRSDLRQLPRDFAGTLAHANAVRTGVVRKLQLRDTRQ